MKIDSSIIDSIVNIFTPHKKQLIKRKEDTIDIVVLRVLRRLTKHRIV